MNINEITGQVVDAAMKVHSVLGPGLLESAYEACLAYELTKRDLKVRRQVELPVVYEDVRIDVGYRIDLLVEDAVIVELKAVAETTPLHQAQVAHVLEAEQQPGRTLDQLQRVAFERRDQTSGQQTLTTSLCVPPRPLRLTTKVPSPRSTNAAWCGSAAGRGRRRSRTGRLRRWPARPWGLCAAACRRQPGKSLLARRS